MEKILHIVPSQSNRWLKDVFRKEISGTSDYIYLFEYKLDGKAEEALQQIERQGYALPYSADRRKLFKIGVDFSSTSGTVDQWKYVEE